MRMARSRLIRAVDVEMLAIKWAGPLCLDGKQANDSSSDGTRVEDRNSQRALTCALCEINSRGRVCQKLEVGRHYRKQRRGDGAWKTLEREPGMATSSKPQNE